MCPCVLEFISRWFLLQQRKPQVAFLICMFFLFSLTDMVLSIYIEDDRELKNLWWELFAPCLNDSSRIMN